MNIIFLNIYLTIILIISDAFCYGFCYEKKGWFKGWLFKEWKPPWSEHTMVPFYRLFFQWPLDILALYLVMYGAMFPPPAPLCEGEYIRTIGMLIAWYLMIKEGGYYLVLGQWQGLVRNETYYEFPNWQRIFSNTNTYWLTRWYFAGKFLFIKTQSTLMSEGLLSFYITDYGFRRAAFGWSCAFGLIIMVISNFI
jgi:hypothetical protein